MSETLRQKTERYINTEHVGNQEWKALARELLKWLPMRPMKDDASGTSEHIITPRPSND